MVNLTVLRFSISHGVSNRRTHSHNSNGSHMGAERGSDMRGSAIPDSLISR